MNTDHSPDPGKAPTIADFLGKTLTVDTSGQIVAVDGKPLPETPPAGQDGEDLLRHFEWLINCNDNSPHIKSKEALQRLIAERDTLASQLAQAQQDNEGLRGVVKHYRDKRDALRVERDSLKGQLVQAQGEAKELVAEAFAAQARANSLYKHNEALRAALAKHQPSSAVAVQLPASDACAGQSPAQPADSSPEPAA